MKICQMIDQLKGGGQERIALEYANQLASRGIQSALLATRSGGDYAAQLTPAVDGKVMTRTGKWDLLPWVEVGRWLRDRDFDLIHAHSVGSLFWAGVLRLALRLRYRIVYHFHMMPRAGWWRRTTLVVVRLFRGQINWCFVTNEGLKTCLSDDLGFPREKIEVLMNPTVFPAEPPEREAGGNASVVVVAQWRRQKDPMTAIRAAALMKQRGLAARWSFLGAEEDEELVRAAHQLIEELGVGDLVQICGRSTNVRGELANATVGVLATHFEGQPVSMIEYCAAALPSVVSNVNGTSQLLSPENGIVGVPPGDAAAMADAIMRIMTLPDAGRSLGVRAYHYMKAKADAEVVFDQVIENYRKILTSS